MKAIFLDRDGVVNRYPGHGQYITRLKDFILLKGAPEAICRLTKAGYNIFVVSNQGGVSKGLYTKKTLKSMTDYMLREIKKCGGKIDKVLYCLHTSEMNCPCRKPKTGLLEKAVKGKRLDRKNSYFIGDSLIDVKAGKTFGCKTILVLTGREKIKDSSQWELQPDFVAKNLAQAVSNILSHRYERA